MATITTLFTAIPAAELTVDQPDFKAGPWKPTTHDGKPYRYCECFELVAGQWEGFVSMERAA